VAARLIESLGDDAMKKETTTRGNRSHAAAAAWKTRKSAVYRAKKSEAASKAALSIWAADHGCSVVFFEGKSGAPRTGIVDALLTRIAPRRPDTIQMRLIQLKSGSAGLTKGAGSEAAEDSRRKHRSELVLRRL